MKHPYEVTPIHGRWRQVMSERDWAEIDPGVNFPRLLTKETRVVTAGETVRNFV